jgi:hypothetical protein
MELILPDNRNSTLLRVFVGWLVPRNPTFKVPKISSAGGTGRATQQEKIEGVSFLELTNRNWLVKTYAKLVVIPR